MYIKNLIKHIWGGIRCLRYGIPYSKGVYIGNNVNIVGGNRIFLESNVCIRPEVDLWASGGNIIIGKGTEIGQRDRISISNRLVIGEKVLLSPNVYITDCDHLYTDIRIPVIDQGIVNKNNKVLIGDHSYIGINSVIIGNIRIGRHCVVAANSVVTSNIPDYCVVGGIPAHIIKKYNLESGCWEKVTK